MLGEEKVEDKLEDSQQEESLELSDSPKEEPKEEPKGESKESKEEPILFIPDEEVKVDLPKPVPTGDEELDLAQDLLHEKGVDHNKVIQEIKDTNQLSSGTVEMLKSKLGTSTFNLLVKTIQKSSQSKLNAQKEEASRLMKVVSKEAFGVDSEEEGLRLWKEMKSKLPSMLTKGGLDDYNKALKSGGTMATLAIQALVREYKMTPGFKDVQNIQEPSGSSTSQYEGIKILNAKDLHRQLSEAEAAGDMAKVKQIEAAYYKQ